MRPVDYQQLESHYRQIHHLEHAAAILSWDEAVMMPPGGGPARGEASASLQRMIHDLSSDDRIEVWLQAAQGEQLDEWQRANVREIHRLYRRATAVPSALVEKSHLAASSCEQAWRSLRPANDWNGFAPLLSEVVIIQREVASALGSALDLDDYDALLDGFEPGGRAAQIEPIFDHLGAFLPDFVREVRERQAGQELVVPAGPFPAKAQKAMVQGLLTPLGFDLERGRLDTSTHPFSGGVAQDVRLTTRFDESDFLTGMMAVLHETGHGKYEQNRPPGWVGQPVGAARGMAMHESQSLLLEMQVARGRAFLEFLGPRLAEAYPDIHAAEPRAFAPEQLHRRLTRVEPGKIRVDADEVTYPAHIILRFGLERRLLSGDLKVNDLPEAWDEGMQRLLGVDTRGDHTNGCMQDIHWPLGLFGYFPTYTLGALIAAQLYASARAALPGLEDHLREGDLSPLDAWLRQHVWTMASVASTDEILERATGRGLDPTAFETHLRRRYLED